MNTIRTFLAAAIASSFATLVLSQTLDPSPMRLGGTLVRVDGTSLIIAEDCPANAQPKQTTVATDSATRLTLDGDPSTLDQFKPGVSVNVVSFQHHKIIISAASIGLSGTLTKVEGKDLTLLTGPKGPQEKEVTVTTDAKTKVRFLPGVIADSDSTRSIAPKDGGLEDLKPGMQVKLIPAEGTPARILVTQTVIKGVRPRK